MQLLAAEIQQTQNTLPQQAQPTNGRFYGLDKQRRTDEIMNQLLNGFSSNKPKVNKSNNTQVKSNYSKNGFGAQSTTQNQDAQKNMMLAQLLNKSSNVQMPISNPSSSQTTLQQPAKSVGLQDQQSLINQQMKVIQEQLTPQKPEINNLRTVQQQPIQTVKEQTTIQKDQLLEQLIALNTRFSQHEQTKVQEITKTTRVEPELKPFQRKRQHQGYPSQYQTELKKTCPSIVVQNMKPFTPILNLEEDDLVSSDHAEDPERLNQFNATKLPQANDFFSLQASDDHMHLKGTQNGHENYFLYRQKRLKSEYEQLKIDSLNSSMVAGNQKDSSVNKGSFVGNQLINPIDTYCNNGLLGSTPQIQSGNNSQNGDKLSAGGNSSGRKQNGMKQQASPMSNVPLDESKLRQAKYFEKSKAFIAPTVDQIPDFN